MSLIRDRLREERAHRNSMRINSTMVVAVHLESVSCRASRAEKFLVQLDSRNL